MKYISGNDIAMTYDKKTLLKLAPIGLILFIMLLFAAIYYFSTAIGSGPFRIKSGANRPNPLYHALFCRDILLSYRYDEAL